MKMKFTNKGSEDGPKNCVYTGWSILQDHCLCNMQYKCTSKNVRLYAGKCGQSCLYQLLRNDCC